VSTTGRVSFEDRRRSLEQRVDQRAERNRLIGGRYRTEPGLDVEARGQSQRLCEETCLAEPRSPVDDQRRAVTVTDSLKRLFDERALSVASAQSPGSASSCFVSIANSPRSV
jgi:hypothetical protein